MNRHWGARNKPNAEPTRMGAAPHACCILPTFLLIKWSVHQDSKCCSTSPSFWLSGSVLPSCSGPWAARVKMRSVIEHPEHLSHSVPLGTLSKYEASLSKHLWKLEMQPALYQGWVNPLTKHAKQKQGTHGATERVWSSLNNYGSLWILYVHV